MKATTLHTAGAVVAVLLASVLIGCSSKPSSSDVMAKVNGKKILRSEVDKYYNNQTAGAPQQPSPEQSQAMRLNILKELIDNEILTQRAEKDGLLATDDEVERKLRELKAPYTEEEFQKRLKERHLTQDDLKQELRRQITVDKVLNKEITSRIEIKDADVTAYYNNHKAEFNLVEPTYHIARVLVTPGPMPQVRNLKNSKAQNDAEAKRKIQEIVNRLDSGEDFATVAMNWSEDPDTAMNGGDLGSVPESGLQGTDPASREAVLKLKPGQYSGVITLVDPQTRKVFGYQVIRLIDKVSAGQRDLNDPRVQQFIRDRLRESSEQLRKAAFYEVLRNHAKVENYYAELILKEAPGVSK
ncbi:MAG: SurA N-terminal domain-containing protein [Terriglobales bacterium]